jgi:hypothetical protein
MAIDFEQYLITLAEATKLTPGRPNISTLWRWWRHGVRGHKLKTIVIGGRRFTSVIWLEEFAAATTAAANGESMPARTPRQRERAIEIAEQETRDAGI